MVMQRHCTQTVPMTKRAHAAHTATAAGTAVTVLEPSALRKHPTWLLSRWGISAGQLSALLMAAAKLEQQVTGPRSLAEPPEPWTGTPEQRKDLKRLQQLVPGALHHDMIWFLRQSGFNIAVAQKQLSKMLSWRHAHGYVSSLPEVLVDLKQAEQGLESRDYLSWNSLQLHSLTMQHIAAELSTGKVYGHQYPDNKGRPVFVVRSCRHRQGEFSSADTQRLFTVVVDEAIKRLRPDQDQFLGIIDLQGFTMANVDLTFATFVIDAFLAMYPGRLAQMVLVDAPWLFKGPWELFKSLLGRHADLVCFVNRQQLKKKFFTAETLPVDFRA